MKKNNKGFTLVELLAALVILGVLAALALPTVVNMMGNSRDKLYVTDAKKLISQAEYKFRVASSEIEKPDDGECLVLSMVYLDNSDFDNPPNNGEYVREASYVVVKNNGGSFEFSVELVEEIRKNVYKGVELSKDSNLSSNSTRHVVSFSKDDLYFVESNTVMGKYNGKQVSTSYINSKLGNSYVSGISKVYNYPDLADSTYNANYSIPKIIRAEYVSSSNKNFNSLDAILKVVATDVDTPTNKLVVYIAPGKGGKYPSTSAPDCDPNQPYNFSECKYQYGSLSDFSLKVNFEDNGYDYSGETASLYILVVDPEGNSDRINPDYKIHTNEAPVIDLSKSGVFKRSSDSINLSTAVLRLNVTDDSTPVGDLEYCLTENKDATTCTGYQKFSNFVNSELTYTFSCGDQCNYDGRALNLKVFLRDNDPTKPLEVSQTFTYNLFKNDVPFVSSLELTSEALPFVTPTSLALTAEVKLGITDSSNANNLDVVLAEDADFTKNVVSYKYSDFANNVSYTFDGLYDGSEKTLYVKVTDEYNSVGYGSKTYGTVHKNSPPVIESIVTTSADLLEEVCPGSKICDKYANNGGAYKLTVDITASDDLIDENDLMVCISDKVEDCSDISKNNFLLYSSGKSKEIILPRTAVAGSYTGTNKTIYVSVYDGYGVAVNNSYNLSQYGSSTKEYMIYKNQPPEINEDEISVVSDNIDYNFSGVKVKFKVNDDLDSINTLKYKIYDDAGGTVKQGTLPSNSPDVLNEIPFVFGGDYDGKERTLTIEITDSYGKVDTATRKYKIHSNEPPKINYVTVETASNPCDSEVCQNQNSLSTNVRFNVTDDLDPSMEDLEMCVSLSADTCDSYKAIKSYTGFKNENNEFTFSYTIPSSGTLPYKGEQVNIYLHIRDKYSDESVRSGSYTLYNNSKPTVDADYPTVKSTNYEEEEIRVDENEVYYTNKNPNLSTFNFALKASDEFVDRTQLKYQICYVTDRTLDITNPDNITCLNNNNFYSYGSSEVSTQTVDLELESYSGQEFFIFAKVYDNYAYACATDSSNCSENDDYIAYSSLAYYSVYNDIPPEITKFTISRPSGVKSYSTLNGAFKVSDPLDTYQYCVSDKGISETEEIPEENLNDEYAKMCTNYVSTEYSGDEASTERTFNYSPGWATTFDADNPSTYLVYLYIKDSHGNISAVSAFPDRIPCDSKIDENGNTIEMGSFLESVDYQVNSGSEEITAAKCNNKCYYWDQAVINGVNVGPSDTANILSYYKRTAVFKDVEDTSLVCAREVIDQYETRCNFRGCFYNSTNKNYKQTVIGYVTHDNTDGTFTHTVGGDTHVPDYYRYQYTSDYNLQTDIITLTGTNNKICGKCFDEGVYNGTIVAYDNNDEIEGQ